MDGEQRKDGERIKNGGYEYLYYNALQIPVYNFIFI